ncbi:EAL domain-containing protein [Pseudomonas sp. 7P_10.2_Bac1]|uniref:EAL domain-containing protein n=1 Tax=Pseudomonas sp. 7P_10.2_Bac1 TaxID=2971614 RepID=UPI0021C9D2BE|nr:EAL domain-containing protein [Pseudomonas sp. 7P_10.2_Bac1]MCU1728779.1 EAL domain-containing protein [Pseudomonas sp. 7P_10.2_Bac1]
MKPTRSLVTPRLLGIVWPFIAVVLFQVLLGCVSLYMLSAVRGYVAGESLWSKGQKDAIHFLNLYADSRDPYTYAQYQQAIGVPQGDHALRVALEQSPPDLKAAREGALQGGNRPEDVAGIIWLYQNFRHLSFLDKAIQQWSVADGYLAKLDELALQMHGRISTEQVTADDTRQWKAQIDAINDAVTPLTYAFSEILGEASRFILQALLIVNLLTALVLICLALWRTHKILLQCRAFADALQLEKERAHVTLESIGDGVITTDTKGAITYMNPAAEQLTHWKFAQAQGLPLGALFKLLDENRADDGFTLIDQILRGRLAGSSEHSRLIQRMDATSVAVTLTGTPIRHAGALSGAVLVLHDMTQERQYIANLSWQATHDALTGVANRREFEYRLERVLQNLTRQQGRHALMFLDLDQFKLVNDTCGHAAGDELLRHVCALLQAGLREGDTLARLGGDEFGILLENCPADVAEKIAEGLRHTVQSLHFAWKGRPFLNTISIGLVYINPVPVTLEAALRAADLACYMAKEKGRNRVQVYHEDDTELSIRFGEMTWVQRLHVALEENRFCLYSQAIVPLGPEPQDRGHLEILLRLHDEQGRVIMPDSFIPAAERYGLMGLIDRWVVESVFKTIAECALREPGRPMEMCAINLSGSTIGDEEFLAFLHEQFECYGVSPGQICFEVTETSAIANLGNAIRFINDLKALGCHFSLDDFCAGMSSFAYLKHLPVDFLKIDGSFVRDMLDDPINRAMVEVINHIGHVMGKRTIAEFVESSQIEHALMEIGVDYAQGYVIERPGIFKVESLWSRPSRPRPFAPKLPGALR